MLCHPMENARHLYKRGAAEDVVLGVVPLLGSSFGRSCGAVVLTEDFLFVKLTGRNGRLASSVGM